MLLVTTAYMHPALGIFLCLVFAILHKQQITMYICKCVMQKKSQ